MNPSYIMALDVGEQRIGIAIASTVAKIASPHGVIINDDDILTNLKTIIEENKIETIVVGLPRNMQGGETNQSKYARDFADTLKANFSLRVVLQDESLTSVQAEEKLKSTKKPYTKEDIDAESATLILDDYIKEQL